ncbi:MAG: caspase family protein [Gemmatimonadetes bacterium]|nr:caspase family protein [Gemmatimonadota bacterium]
MKQLLNRRVAYIATMVAILPLLAFGPQERTALTRWAFIVGVSDYIHFEDVEGGDLPGAEHDARRIRDALVMRRGFPEENVRLVLNHDATKSAIREGITGWLVQNARPGDNVVIFFAGHGSQMWDESGDEDDGLDETLAPADANPTSTEFDISDDEFNDWLGLLPTDNVLVVLDNCNSGTGTRDVTPFSRGRLLGRDINDVDRPAGVTRRALPGQAGDVTGFDPQETRVLELAAAQPFQVAVDAYFPSANGQEAFHGGAFTTFLVQQLWRAPENVTYENVFEDAYEALKRNRFQQDPYISEDVSLKDFPLFFVDGGPSGSGEMALPVVSTSGRTAQLGAGLALGITPGSTFETPSGARLVVASVGQRTTTVDVVSGSVRDGDQARLTAHVYLEIPLLVNMASIDTRLTEALRTALAGAPAIRIIDDENLFSHLIVRRRGDELRVIGSDGFARHEAIGTTPSAMAALGSILRTEAAAKSLGDMDNPAQSFGLTLQLLGGKTKFGVGEDIAFIVESDRDGFVTLVDIGTDGTVAMLLPNQDDPSMQIRAGRRLEYPGADLAFTALPPVGGGMVRAFLTERPLDITIPAGELYASGGEGFAAAVAEALKRAAGLENGAVRLNSWGTASIVYEITN